MVCSCREWADQAIANMADQVVAAKRMMSAAMDDASEAIEEAMYIAMEAVMEAKDLAEELIAQVAVSAQIPIHNIGKGQSYL